MRGASQGFTLVELLVALALAGIVMVLLTDELRLASLGFERISHKSEQLAVRRDVEDLLRRELGSAVAAPLVGSAPPFTGEASSMKFLSLSDDSGPGLYQIELGFQAQDGGRLMLTRRLAEPAAGRQVERTVLASHVRGFKAFYFGAPAPNSEAKWLERWTDVRYPPSLVRIFFDAGGETSTPPMTLRVWGAPQ
ncbi:MAG TPA: prepilin-type N-terminal cleavage/methylation domain-containing protein [Alphaproteobacteria bacterium]|nr:prepilin-type N-terminal cleavage/methylation domain-containing protein [Alphaproteobacteria bacterium]